MNPRPLWTDVPTTLALLAEAGILQRAAQRTHAYLRVSPRFLAYAEGTGGRRRLTGLPDTVEATLEAALSGWDEYHGDAREGARLLAELLAERGQLGGLVAVFPSLDRYGLVAARAA